MPTGSTDKLEYIPPNGKTLYVEEFSGDAAFIADAMVCISYNGEIIFSTHGSANRKASNIFVGDGVKKLIIDLDNSSNGPETIGAYWRGRLLDS